MGKTADEMLEDLGYELEETYGNGQSYIKDDKELGFFDYEENKRKSCGNGYVLQ